MPPSHNETITYTATGSMQSVDISDLDKAVVDYCDGPGGGNISSSGGRVENAEIDLSGESTLYLWVGETGGSGTRGFGRYLGDKTTVYDPGYNGAGSSEISFSSDAEADGKDAPFLVGAGGGAAENSGGARAGSGSQLGYQEAPPKGGSEVDDEDAKGAIDDENRGLVTGGTTIKGGGSTGDTDGEIKITYKSAPTAPSDLIAEVGE